MIARLLSLLDKMLGEIRRQMRVHPEETLLDAKGMEMLDVLTRVCRQQKGHFKSGGSRESIPDQDSERQQTLHPPDSERQAD